MRAGFCHIVALNYVAELEPDNYLLCTDSLIVIICIENLIVKNILVQRIQELCHREIERGVEISMLRIPSHMGIRCNDLADHAAKNSTGRPQEFIPIPFI